MDQSLQDFGIIASKNPVRKLRLTSIFFTIGLLLMALNFFIDVTKYFTEAQPHTLGGAIMAFASSILTQIYDSTS